MLDIAASRDRQLWGRQVSHEGGNLFVWGWSKQEIQYTFPSLGALYSSMEMVFCRKFSGWCFPFFSFQISLSDSSLSSLSFSFPPASLMEGKRFSIQECNVAAQRESRPCVSQLSKPLGQLPGRICWT